MAYTRQAIVKALTLPAFDAAAAHQLMMPRFDDQIRPSPPPGGPRLGGVLVLLYQLEEAIHVVLTRRRDDLSLHAGQISFPGGRHEPPETLLATALRETHEEIGIRPDAVEILGELTPFYILPSNFEVHPFVGWSRAGKRPDFRPDAREVAEIIEVPLSYLLNAANRREEPWLVRDFPMTVPYFAVGQHKVWGATAMMLSDLLERIRRVTQIPVPPPPAAKS